MYKLYIIVVIAGIGVSKDGKIHGIPRALYHKGDRGQKRGVIDKGLLCARGSPKKPHYMLTQYTPQFLQTGAMAESVKNVPYQLFQDTEVHG